jgi:geranylgeranyl diphosphate synthase type I
VAGGELLDTEAAFSDTDIKQYLKIARFKTASYSFVGPLLSGAVAGQAGPDIKTAFAKYGLSLGVAYQLADDILGVFGDPQATGKPIVSDMREGKKTYLIHKAREQASPEQLLELDQWWGNSEVGNRELKRIQEILMETGAKKAAHELMMTYADEARETLTGINIEAKAKETLLSIIDAAVARNK